ncbi:hypothetical protein COBT_001263 [Conglomerata obtusa]
MPVSKTTDEKNEERKITLAAGIFAQCNSTLGISIITYPHIFAQLGYLLSILCIASMSVVSAFTLYFLAKCAKDTNSNTFDETVSHVFGHFRSFLCILVLYLACLLPLIFYLNISVDFYNEILKYFGINDHRPAISIVTAIVCFMICQIYNEIGSLDFINIISIAALVLFILYIIYDFIFCTGVRKFKTLKVAELNCETLKSVSFVIFGFMSHSTIIPIVSCIETMNQSAATIVIANFISMVFYITTGFIGFVVHPNSEENYLLNDGSNCNFKHTLMFFLSTVNILSFPLLMIPATRNLYRLTNFIFDVARNTGTLMCNILFNLFISLLVVLGGRKMDTLESLFFIVGSLVMFILPTFLFLKLQKKISFFEWLFITLSLMISIFSIYMGLRGFIVMFE